MFNSKRTAEPYFQILLNLSNKNYNIKQRKTFPVKNKRSNKRSKLEWNSLINPQPSVNSKPDRD